MADALSRINTNALHFSYSVDLKEIATAQETDPDLVKFQTTTFSLKLKAKPLPSSDGTILCDKSTGLPRPYVPEQFHHKVFVSLHSLSHPSIRGTQHLITTRFVLMLMFACGPEPVYNARSQKSKDIQLFHWEP